MRRIHSFIHSFIHLGLQCPGHLCLCSTIVALGWCRQHQQPVTAGPSEPSVRISRWTCLLNALQPACSRHAHRRGRLNQQLFRSPFSTGNASLNASVRPSPPPAPPNKPPPSGPASSTQAGGPAGTAGPAGAAPADAPATKAGITDPFFLIPFLGLPTIGLWYGWEVLKQNEHEARMASVLDAIKEKRELLEEKFGPVRTSPGKAAVSQTHKPGSSSSSAPAATSAAVAPATTSSTSSTAAAQQSVAGAAGDEGIAGVGGAAAKQELPKSTGTSSTITTPATASTTTTSAASQPAPSTAGAPTTAKDNNNNSASTASVTSATATAVVTAAAGAGAAAEQVLGAVSKALQQGGDGNGGDVPAAAAVAGKDAAGTGVVLDTPAGVVGAGVGSVEGASGAAAGPGAGVVLTQEPYVPVLKSADEPEVPSVKQGVMGVTLDLSPSGLVQFANERGLGPGQDWAAFTEHHKQATADAELLSRAVHQIAAWHQAEVQGLRAEADAAAKRTAEILEKAKANTEGFKRLLRQHQEMAAELRTLEVRQAEKRVALSASHAAEAERQARLAVLDELRLQVGALAAAHDARVQQQAASHLSHSLTLTILSLEHALEHGAPLKPHLNKLVARVQQAEADLPSSTAVITAAAAAATGSEKPPVSSVELGLLKSIAASITADAADRGVPTVQQLQARLSKLKGSLSALSMLPAGQDGQAPGIISHALAGLFAKFKVDESSSVRALGPDAAMASGSIDAAVAAAEMYLTDKKVLDALTVLKHAAKGSAAAGAIEAWCADASARASADQALRLLRAHATVLAASVV